MLRSCLRHSLTLLTITALSVTGCSKEEIIKNDPKSHSSTNLFAEPGDPISDCPNGCYGGGISTPKFVSSEQTAAQGPIYDLKCIYAPSGRPSPQPADGYVKMLLDLNDGVGGHYIYLTYTRDYSKVSCIANTQITNSIIDALPVSPITAVTIKSINPIVYIAPANPPTDFAGIETTSQYGGCGNIMDVNEGAGGDNVYMYQTGYSAYGSPIEVGVLSGDTPTIQPPSGWTRENVDLNKGAISSTSGVKKYIYLCWKRR